MDRDIRRRTVARFSSADSQLIVVDERADRPINSSRVDRLVDQRAEQALRTDAAASWRTCRPIGDDGPAVDDITEVEAMRCDHSSAFSLAFDHPATWGRRAFPGGPETISGRSELSREQCAKKLRPVEENEAASVARGFRA